MKILSKRAREKGQVVFPEKILPRRITAADVGNVTREPTHLINVDLIYSSNLCPEICDPNQISESMKDIERVLLTSNLKLEPINLGEIYDHDPFAQIRSTHTDHANCSGADDRLSEAARILEESESQPEIVKYKRRVTDRMDMGSFYAPYIPQHFAPQPTNMHRYLGVEDDISPEAFDKLSRRTIMEYFFDVNTSHL